MNKQDLDMDKIKLSLSPKYMWGLLVGVFCLASTANWQLFTIKASLSSLDKRTRTHTSVAVVEDAAVSLHNTNVMFALSEVQIRQIIRDIWEKYQKIESY